jgi:hypothetical protein
MVGPAVGAPLRWGIFMDSFRWKLGISVLFLHDICIGMGLDNVFCGLVWREDFKFTSWCGFEQKVACRGYPHSWSTFSMGKSVI